MIKLIKCITFSFKISLMKKHIFIALFLLKTLIINAQIQSSCSAPDSIKIKYVNDADRLALRSLYSRHLPDTSSIFIPQIQSDSVLNALLAVYNTDSLPERDTIITYYQIHSKPDPGLT